MLKGSIILFHQVGRFIKEKNYTQLQNTELMQAIIMDCSEQLTNLLTSSIVD